MKTLKVLVVGLAALAGLNSCNKELDEPGVPIDFDGEIHVVINNHTNKEWMIKGLPCGNYSNHNVDIAILKPNVKNKKIATALNIKQVTSIQNGNGWHCDNKDIIPSYRLIRVDVNKNTDVKASSYTIHGDTLICYEVNVW